MLIQRARRVPEWVRYNREMSGNVVMLGAVTVQNKRSPDKGRKRARLLYIGWERVPELNSRRKKGL